MKKQHACMLAISILMVLSFLVAFEIRQVKATSETIVDINFDDDDLGFAPASVEWSGHTSLQSVNYSNSYVEISDDTCVSASYSLKCNDSSASSPYTTHVSFWFDTLSYEDATIQVWIRTNNQSTSAKPSLTVQQYGGGLTTAITYCYFKIDGTIQAMTGTYHEVGTWAVDTWVNITIAFNSTYVNYYVNGSLTALGYYHKANFNSILIDTTKTTGTGVVYVDDIKLSGTTVSEPIYHTDDAIDVTNGFISTPYYKARIQRVFSATSNEGQIAKYRVKTEWGSFVNIVSSLRSLLWSETENSARVQKGIGDLTSGTITITNTTSTVEYMTTGVLANEIRFTNIIYFDNTEPHIYFDVYRWYNFSNSNIDQKQLDFLFLSNEVVKAYVTNMTGIVGFTTKGTSLHDFGGPTGHDYFPFYGYYFRQGVTVASIVTYTHENDALTSGVQMLINQSLQTTYNEWELTFAKAYGSGGSAVEVGTIEQCSGVLTYYTGDEETTNSIQTFSEQLYADWSDEKAKMAYLVDSHNSIYMTSTGTLMSATYGNDLFTAIINATSGQTTQTQVYCGTKGQPAHVVGADVWSYDADTTTCTMTVVHSSDVELKVDWLGESAIGVYPLSISVLQNGVPTPATVVVDGENKTVFGLTTWNLPYGNYFILVYCGDERQTKSIFLSGPQSIGFDFQVSESPNWAVLAWTIPVFIAVVVGIYFLLFRKK